MSLAMKPLLPPPADVSPDWNGSVVAVITESVEPVYVHDKRDTVEASPLSVESPQPPRHEPDKIAEERGIPPLRVPDSGRTSR